MSKKSGLRFIPMGKIKPVQNKPKRFFSVFQESARGEALIQLHYHRMQDTLLP